MENDAAFVLLHHNFRWWKSSFLPSATISHRDNVNNFNTSRENERERKGTIFIVKWIWIRLPRSAVNEIKYLRSIHTYNQAFASLNPFPYQFIKRANNEHVEMANQHTPPPKRRFHRIINNCQRKSILQLNLNMHFIIQCWILPPELNNMISVDSVQLQSKRDSA